VLAEVLAAFREILATMIEEVQAAPVRQIAEVLQFAVLIGIVWVVALGFGKRRGFVLSMLAERRESMSERIAEALDSETMLASAKHDAAAVERTARAEARRVLSEATRDAERIEADAKAVADADAETVTARAQSAHSRPSARRWSLSCASGSSTPWPRRPARS